ncbi:putative acid anhydride hydrolase KNAG_0G03010 [Huiozyma naganishii CBS 8797]|uniref:Cation-transporting ATPase n=1 Tax=Huiozyma naganishii (strain ATCC MYA-139 / BCRC 22969 / CBS 8797 / KCTC 17520 / NBRC 10181 / NCYC 3082 / Yp74L-3) TaxID=1071383 RepID=J7RNZ0_HUIN7|nr:hypothetical protein KNAG_0G03010 [Kazachstania naganishii CBS 8797]CCK71358.1 hypothetical protein KNAG_0G03010 [Kazachstania naganishii CBS 8797]
MASTQGTPGRSGGRRAGGRQSVSSNWTAGTGATLTSGLLLDQNSSEPYAGASFEAVPSSIVSFHHPHSIQSSGYLTGAGVGAADQSHSHSQSQSPSQPLIERPGLAGPSQRRSSSRSSSRVPQFRFFTDKQISDAEGAATLEHTDYNTHWEDRPAYETERLFGVNSSSRGSSAFASRRSSLSRIGSYGSYGSHGSLGADSYLGHPLTRHARRSESVSGAGAGAGDDVHSNAIYQTRSTDSSASLSRYTITDRIPSEIEDQDSGILDETSSGRSRSQSTASGSSRDNEEDNNGHDDNHSHYKKGAYHNEFLKAEYHEKFYAKYAATQTFQRFYITEEDIVIGIAGYRNGRLRVWLYNLLCWFTLGVAYVVFKWFPARKVKLVGVRCPLGKAEWVVIENEFGEFIVEQVDRRWYNRPLSTVLILEKSEQGGGDGVGNDAQSLDNTTHHHSNDANPNMPILVSFQYRYITFIYSPLEDIFRTNNNWADLDWLNLNHVQRGLPSVIQEDRIIAFDKNQINLKVKTTSEILFNEVLHPFYVFQIFSIILWSLDEYYYYAACIFLISVLSISETLIETKKTSQNLSEMSHFNCEVRVFRDEFWTNVNSSELVPGDIYEVSDPALTVLPCDCILLTGDCIVNESMLTGESVPVPKAPATEDTMFQLLEDFQNTQISSFVSKSFLFNGTKIIRARYPPGHSAALAMVVRTGFSTTKGSLVRSMVFPKPTGFKFYSDSFKYIGVMAIVAMLGFSLSCIRFVKIGLDKRTMILRALDIITVVVPPALPATLTVGTSFALSRLKRKGIFCISPTRVNIGGKIDVMCFDKTGTLTEDGLDVLGVHLSEPGQHGFKFGTLKSDSVDLFDKFSLNDCSSPLDVKSKNLLMSLLTCHSLRLVDGELIGDPLDFKMFQFTGWSFEEDFQKQKFHSLYEERHEGVMFPENNDIIPAVVHPNSDDPENKFIDNDPHNFLGIIRSFDFLSELRRMSVIVKLSSDDIYWAFTKGAPEVISEICNKNTLPSDYNEILDHYTHSGNRVIACAGKILPKHTWLYSQKVSREEVECNMEFLGFIIFENKLKEATTPTLKVLQDASIRTIMCTGDNVLTAISVGRECGLVKEPKVYVPYLNNPDGEFLVWRDVDNYEDILDVATLQPVSQETTTDYTLAVTGEVFRILFASENNIPEDYINEILLKTSVYARMSPDEKHELMEQLQKIDYTVGFCGDGANDCGALKAADVGISLSEAEASVAAPFTSKVFDIRCVLDVIKEGRASLVTSFACFQYMSLYSAIQFITITILYSRGSNLGDFQFLYIDLFLIVPIAIFMSWSKPFDKLAKKRPSANLVSLKILLPMMLSFVIILLFQVIPWLYVQEEPWYVKPVVGGDDAVQSSDNTVLFYVSNFQYILTAVILSVGPPYREPMSKNFGFIIDILVSLLASTLLMFVDLTSGLGKLFQLTFISGGFKTFIVVWAIVNYFVQAYIPGTVKTYFKKRRSSKKYKNILRERNTLQTA